MTKGVLLVISGPAGSGKGTVTKKLIETGNFAFSVSATTRAPRPSEKDGIDYHFVTREDFEERIQNNAMLEYTEYCGNYYGTPKKEAEEVLAEGKNLILEIDVAGGTNVKKIYPDAVLIMLLPPSAKVQEKRLRGRGTEPEPVIQARLKRAIEELDFLPSYDYVVYNEDNGVDKCARQIADIASAEKCRLSHLGDVKKTFFED